MGASFLCGFSSRTREESRFVLVPVPFDATASYGTGARLGPARIIEASEQLELFDEELLCQPWKQGIFTEDPLELPLDPEKVASVVREKEAGILAEKRIPVVLGGDHSVSIGAIKAASEHFGNIDIVQFDAHTDLRDQYQGSRFSHACVMRRVWELGNVIQIGIRSMSKEEWTFLQEHGCRAAFAREIHQDFPKALERVKGMLSGNPVYVTLDVDCMDPSVMPATGTPEPGGLTWYQVTALLRAIAQKARVVAFDAVELAPVPGLHYPEFTVARLIYKMMGYIGCYKA